MEKERIDNLNLDFLGNIVVPPPKPKVTALERIIDGAKTFVSSIPPDTKQAALEKILGKRIDSKTETVERYNPGTTYSMQKPQGNITFSNPMIIIAIIAGVMLLFLIIKKLT